MTFKCRFYRHRLFLGWKLAQLHTHAHTQPRWELKQTLSRTHAVAQFVGVKLSWHFNGQFAAIAITRQAQEQGQTQEGHLKFEQLCKVCVNLNLVANPNCERQEPVSREQQQQQKKKLMTTIPCNRQGLLPLRSSRGRANGKTFKRTLGKFVAVRRGQIIANDQSPSCPGSPSQSVQVICWLACYSIPVPVPSRTCRGHIRWCDNAGAGTDLPALSRIQLFGLCECSCNCSLASICICIWAIQRATCSVP